MLATYRTLLSSCVVLWLSLAIAGRIVSAAGAIEMADCDGDGRVSITDLVTIVNVSLNRLALDQCISADMTGDGRVTVDEIVRAVNLALGRRPTPSGTAHPTPTATPRLVASETPTQMETFSVSPTQTPTITDTGQPEPTQTFTRSATASETTTVPPTPLPTSNPSSTAAATGTQTLTPTPHPSSTMFPTAVATPTSPAFPPTFTGTPTKTFTLTATGTFTPTPSNTTAATNTPEDRGQLFVATRPEGGSLGYLVLDAATGATRFDFDAHCSDCVPFVTETIQLFNSGDFLETRSRSDGTLQEPVLVAEPRVAPRGGAFLRTDSEVLYRAAGSLYRFDPQQVSFGSAPLWTNSGDWNLQLVVPAGPAIHIVQYSSASRVLNRLLTIRADTGGEIDERTILNLLDAARGDHILRPIMATYDGGGETPARILVTTTGADGMPCLLYQRQNAPQDRLVEATLARWQDWLYIASKQRLVVLRVSGCEVDAPAIIVDLPSGTVTNMVVSDSGEAYLSHAVPGDGPNQDWVVAAPSPEGTNFDGCTPGLQIGSIVLEWNCPRRWGRFEASLALPMLWARSPSQ